MKTEVAVIGASGFTGLELIKILLAHPFFEITTVANTEGGVMLSDIHPSLEGVFDIEVKKADPKTVAEECSVALLALPHKSAMEFAKELLALGVKVVDLSADYRLSLEHYESNYCPHTDKENLSRSAYALPELFRGSLKNRDIISSPGCYPTATLLGLAPFLNYIKEGSNIFIDAKSGVSGAGKKCSETTHFVSVNENLFAYNPIKHRHAIEIYEKLELLSQKRFNINFVPHLLPITRGMLVSIYFESNEEFEPIEVLREFYKNEPFIRVKESPVTIKNVAGSHFCDIFAARNGSAIFISSSIDNLLRGAASQAIAGLNIMFGLDETVALPKISYVP